MTFLPAVAGVTYAYANHGRWVADCVTPYCRNALQLFPPDPVFTCSNCWARADVVWPFDVPMIEEVLLARPDPATRNWVPGEPVLNLVIENLAHGIDHATSPEVGAAASRLVLDATGDTPVLRLLDEPIVIDAAPRPQLEG